MESKDLVLIIGAIYFLCMNAGVALPVAGA